MVTITLADLFIEQILIFCGCKGKNKTPVPAKPTTATTKTTKKTS